MYGRFFIDEWMCVCLCYFFLCGLFFYLFKYIVFFDEEELFCFTFSVINGIYFCWKLSFFICIIFFVSLFFIRRKVGILKEFKNFVINFYYWKKFLLYVLKKFVSDL